MDRFKKYLQENAGGLDTDTPSVDLWEGIEKQSTVNRKRLPKKILFFRYAAAACIVAVLTIAIQHLRFDDKKKNLPEISQKMVPGNPAAKDSVTNNTTAPLPSIVIAHPSKNKSVKKVKKETPVVVAIPYNGYEQLINERVKKLGGIAVLAASPGYFNIFTAQLKQMDNDERMIKKEIHRNGYSDELMDQLIEVYQQKLNLLKRFQSEIQKMNNRVKQQRPVESSIKPYYIQL